MWQPVPMHRLPMLLALSLLVSCAPQAPDDVVVGPAPVRVASGPDAETDLLAHTVVALLGAEGIDAEVVSFADSRDARQALELGAVDVRVGYTGESWLESIGRADPPGDPRASFQVVRDHDAERDIVWLPPRIMDGLDTPPANATFAFVVQGPPSIDADLQTMSQLATRLSAQPDALVCVDQQFAARPDGLSAVLSAYSVRSDRQFLAASPSEAVLGVGAGDCIAGLTTTTDGRAWRAGLRPLVDDLQIFPAFVVTPQVRASALEQHQRLRSALTPLPAHLTGPMLGRWNARLVGGEPVDQVAGDAAVQLLHAAGRVLDEDPGD
ncbi:MAG: glycine betaine ABC transporter substrate-binding protein [Nitriliruptoraceae bacterium]